MSALIVGGRITALQMQVVFIGPAVLALGDLVASLRSMLGQGIHVLQCTTRPLDAFNRQ